MATRCSGAGAVLLLLASALPLAAQSPSRLAGLNRTLSLGFTSSNISDPILREPGGGRELSVPQSASAWTGRVGYTFASDVWGAEFGVTRWSADFEAFDYDDPGNPMDPRVGYADPSVSLWFFDMAVLVAPWRAVPAALVGLLGLGRETESYTLSGAEFPQWDGAKTEEIFQYSYGLGVKLFPVRYLTLLAEYRFVPGDLVSELKPGVCYIYSYGSVSSSTCGGGKVENYTKIFSVGAALNLPLG